MMFMTPEELFQEGVYVSFSSPGNTFYEDSNDGLLKPRITNAPDLIFATMQCAMSLDTI